MAYGDMLGYGSLKNSKIKYNKLDKNCFENDYIKVGLINTNNWHYTLQFKNRKEWFKFVKTINKLNKDFKKLSNIEKGSE